MSFLANFPIAAIWATAQSLFNGFGGFIAMLVGVLLVPYLLEIVVDLAHNASQRQHIEQKRIDADPYQRHLTKHEKELIIESQHPLLRTKIK